METNALKQHLSGEKILTDDDLHEIELAICEDSPYCDSWRNEGYESCDSWKHENADFLKSFEEMCKLFNEICMKKEKIMSKDNELLNVIDASLAECSTKTEALKRILKFKVDNRGLAYDERNHSWMDDDIDLEDIASRYIDMMRCSANGEL